MTEREPVPATSAPAASNEASPTAAPVTAPAAPAPQEAIADYERAMQAMSTGNNAAAEQGFKQLAQRYPTYAGPLVNLAIIYAKTDRNQEAEAALQDAVRRNPTNAPAYNQLGILYRKLGRFKDADEAYKKAVASDPNYALAYLNQGVLYDLYLEQPQRALESFQRYLELEPNPQPQVKSWVKELRTRLGIREPAAAEAAPAPEAPEAAPEAGA
jgi:tetratricopeptide (TPR) repeat protein